MALQDPHRYAAYLAHNPFLPDINNEKASKNTQYAANLVALDKLVLVKFAYDSMGEWGCQPASGSRLQSTGCTKPLQVASCQLGASGDICCCLRAIAVATSCQQQHRSLQPTVGCLGLGPWTRTTSAPDTLPQQASTTHTTRIKPSSAPNLTHRCHLLQSSPRSPPGSDTTTAACSSACSNSRCTRRTGWA
jgi:hypothetical protein